MEASIEWMQSNIVRSDRIRVEVMNEKVLHLSCIRLKPVCNLGMGVINLKIKLNVKTITF